MEEEAGEEGGRRGEKEGRSRRGTMKKQEKNGVAQGTSRCTAARSSPFQFDTLRVVCGLFELFGLLVY